MHKDSHKVCDCKRQKVGRSGHVAHPYSKQKTYGDEFYLCSPSSPVITLSHSVNRSKVQNT